MKLLTAGRGTRPEDFSFTVPGELVEALEQCDASLYGGLGDRCACGCPVGWYGLSSGLATTLAVVRELAIDRAQLEEITGDAESAEALIAAAASYPAGAKVRRRLDALEVR